CCLLSLHDALPIFYRRIWKVIFTGFFEPVFYLLSIGIGIGALVGDLTLPGGHIVSYTAFMAPALMATSAMNGAVMETTFNIFFRSEEHTSELQSRENLVCRL